MSEVVFVLDQNPSDRATFETLHPQFLRSREDVAAIVPQLSGQRVLWIAQRQYSLCWLIEEFSLRPRRRDALLMLEPLSRPEEIFSLTALFGRIVPGSGILLAFGEIANVLRASDREAFCIGGIVNQTAQTVTLFRGDLATIVVPFSFFDTSPTGVEPDFNRFSVTDWGRTLAFGDYEATMDVVLYELDADYRRKVKSQRLTEEQSLGASIRRLRKQRKRKRSDFSPISAKTIARIERGEHEPRSSTLERIAEVLSVPVDEIEDY